MRVAILLFTMFGAALGAAGTGYHLVKKVPVGGEGGWDYLIVDPGARRVYVSHASEVDVLDADSLALVGKIEGLHGVHGIAIAADLGRGFVSNGGSSTMTIFDLKTLAKIGDEVATGQGPDAILYHSGTQQVFAFNGRGKSATVINGKTGAVAGTVSLGGTPEFAATDGSGAVYVNIEDTSEVLRIDPKKRSVETRWKLAPCEEPSGMAMDAKHQRLFVGCHNNMTAVVDAANGRVIATLPIGKGVDATAYDPGAGLVFNSCGDGNTSVTRQLGADDYKKEEPVKTAPRARTMALDPKTHRLFLPIAEFETAAPGQRAKMKPGSFAVLVYEP
ncbi:MAG: YncE family protein [Acidobacteriota bacterium]|nr:YncE family protein [Acidobacteriota bacterium]